MVLKVLASRYVDQDAAKHELNIDQRLKVTQSHDRSLFVRTTVDSFEVIGPDDMHYCLVYEPLREPLSIFQGAGMTASCRPALSRYT